MQVFGINIKDQVVVLDEGHNIEDTAREVSSLTVIEGDLASVVDELADLEDVEELADHLASKQAVHINNN